jgi:hypothetical protein
MNKALVIIFALALLACSKNKDEEKVTQEALFQMIVSVPWQVSLFAQGDSLLTENFTDYKFHFSTSSAVTAVKGANTAVGNWYSSKSDDVQSKTGLTLNITFIEPPEFVSLTHGWDVLSANQGMIILGYTDLETTGRLTLSAASE